MQERREGGGGLEGWGERCEKGGTPILRVLLWGGEVGIEPRVLPEGEDLKDHHGIEGEKVVTVHLASLIKRKKGKRMSPGEYIGRLDAENRRQASIAGRGWVKPTKKEEGGISSNNKEKRFLHQ